MKYTHLVFWVQDNTLSEKFYRKIGFEVTASSDRQSVVKLGDLEIMLVSIRDEEVFQRDVFSGDKGRGMYIYVYVDDVDAKHRQLIDLGLEPASAPRDWDWGNREFVIKDPDGYKLCFWHETTTTSGVGG